MKIKDIMNHVDHTVLSPTATSEDIENCVGDAIRFGCACAMVPPCFVKFAVDKARGKIPVATVIGFPHGNSTTIAKCAEAADAVANGAGEIDMVANISWIKEGRWEAVEKDIREVKQACDKAPLKVIIETCLLSDEEKIKMCKICGKAGADWIKTSTGFSTSGQVIFIVSSHSPPPGCQKCSALAGWKTRSAPATSKPSMSLNRLMLP